MSQFHFALAFVLEMEGGYVADLGDGAGATNFGITQKSYPDLDIKGLTAEQAGAIYRRDYYDALQLDRLPLALAVATFDTAVNHGPVTAYKLLQGALGVVADGIPGPATISAAQAQRIPALERLLVARAMRYALSPNFQKFGRAWMKRLLACQRYCGGLP